MKVCHREPVPLGMRSTNTHVRIDNSAVTLWQTATGWVVTDGPLSAREKATVIGVFTNEQQANVVRREAAWGRL